MEFGNSSAPSTVERMDTKTDQDRLREEMRNIIEEARVILPGLQALFGFQTIAVFNERFDDLPTYAQACHLIGLGFVIVSVALAMTPAIYHRVVGPSRLSWHTIAVGSRLLRCAIAPLACGLALDMFTVILMATADVTTSVWSTLATFVFLSGLWCVFPLRARARARQSAAH